MRTPKVLLVLGLLLAGLLPTAAHAQFQLIAEQTIKPGQEPAFESFVKSLIEAANKVADAPNWATFQVAGGQAGPTYRIVLSFNNWAERGKWTSGGPRAVLAKAYGQQEVERIWGLLATSVQSSTDTIWRVLPEVSVNLPAAGGSPATLYQVTVREVRRDRVAEYNTLLRKFTEAYEAAANKPTVGRRALVYGSGTGVTFARYQAFDSWAEMDNWNAAELLQKHFGADWAAMVDQLRRIVVNQKTFISVYRRDLSRPAN